MVNYTQSLWAVQFRFGNQKLAKLKFLDQLLSLKKISGQKIINLHRPFIDEVKFTIDGEEYSLAFPMFLIVGLKTGSMPYAQVHYPLKIKEWFEENFPADFITEYVAQTRGWFYTLMVLSTALFNRAPFKNVICHGTILDENSQNYQNDLEITPIH